MCFEEQLQKVTKKKKTGLRFVLVITWTYISIKFLLKVFMVASGKLSLTHFFLELEKLLSST